MAISIRITPVDAKMICFIYSLETFTPLESIPEEYIKQTPIVIKTITEKNKIKSKFSNILSFLILQIK